ncbi:protein kinase domain-containing protein [Rubrivirga sp.]|uniref:serine/threonine-protein kinase n=1 Tax=Rubrivirga sp. TaxID=1885344 RepID=UPI003B52F803
MSSDADPVAERDPTLDRLRRSLEIAGEAYDVPTADRAAFVAHACGDDDALRQAVADLLDFDARSHTLLDGGVGELFAMPEPGDVGGYRVVGELGRGGMGVVYAAERVDGTFEKTVALKLVQASKASEEAARRFARERRVLARLDHPGIARLLDGGVTPDGRPYFIMERVDGQPLTAYADAHGLNTDARLALLLDVCDAVAHAHRLLVVHRDLKPSNVFVARDETGAAQVKLLDFGIAKALDEDDDDVLTQTGGGALTPAYAAPEQVAGEPVTAATDVYALGVMAYELLVGERPYAFASRAPGEVARVVREAQPARPSDAVRTTAGAEASEARWSAPPKRLRGDLDAIVLRALRKEPERRYATAGELAADLRRHVEGRPVTARGDGLGYRTGRFVRRHTAAVAFVAALALALVGGTAAVVWQAQETAREAARANATLDYVLGMFEAVDPVELEGGQLRPADLLAPGLRQAAALDGQPLVQASLLEGLGRLGVSLGLFPTADSVLQRAVDVRRRVQGPDHPDLGVPLTLLTESLTAELRFDEALATGREATRVLGSGRRPTALADAQIALAYAHYGKYETDAAKALFRAALANTREPSPRVVALSGLATQLEESDSLDAALPLFRQATDLARRTFGPTDPRTADALYDYAEAVKTDGDPARALVLHEEALAVYEQAFGQGDHRTGRSLYSLAVLHHGDAPAVAERYYRRALDGYDGSSLDPDHSWRDYAHVGLGGLLLEMGRADEALPLLRSGAAAFAKEWGPSDLRALTPRAQYGAALFDTGRTAEGIAVLSAVESTVAREDPASPFHLAILRKLAKVLAQAGRAEEARAVAQTSNALQETAR